MSRVLWSFTEVPMKWSVEKTIYFDWRNSHLSKCLLLYCYVDQNLVSVFGWLDKRKPLYSLLLLLVSVIRLKPCWTTLIENYSWPNWVQYLFWNLVCILSVFCFAKLLSCRSVNTLILWDIGDRHKWNNTQTRMHTYTHTL